MIKPCNQYSEYLQSPSYSRTTITLAAPTKFPGNGINKDQISFTTLNMIKADGTQDETYLYLKIGNDWIDSGLVLTPVSSWDENDNMTRLRCQIYYSLDYKICGIMVSARRKSDNKYINLYSGGVTSGFSDLLDFNFSTAVVSDDLYRPFFCIEFTDFSHIAESKKFFSCSSRKRNANTIVPLVGGTDTAPLPSTDNVGALMTSWPTDMPQLKSIYFLSTNEFNNVLEKTSQKIGESVSQMYISR